MFQEAKKAVISHSRRGCEYAKETPAAKLSVSVRSDYSQLPELISADAEIELIENTKIACLPRKRTTPEAEEHVGCMVIIKVKCDLEFDVGILCVLHDFPLQPNQNRSGNVISVQIFNCPHPK